MGMYLNPSAANFTQIKNKQYFASFEHFHGEVLFVGVNYDEQSKTQECRMEWFNKE